MEFKVKVPKSDPKAAAKAREAQRFAAYEAKQKRKEARSRDKTPEAERKASIAPLRTVVAGVRHSSSAVVSDAAVAPNTAAVPAPAPELEVDPAATRREPDAESLRQQRRRVERPIRNQNDQGDSPYMDPIPELDESEEGGFEAFKQASLDERRRRFERESPEQSQQVFTDPVLMDDWEIAQVEEIEAVYALQMSRSGS